MDPKTSKIVALSLVGVLAAGAAVWGVVHSGEKKAEEPVLAAVPDEYSIDKLRAVSKEDPGKAFDQMRETMDRKDLTEEQRMQIGDNMRTVMEEQMQARMDEYYRAPEAEREAILDRQIDELQKFRKRMEERREKEEAERAAEGKQMTEEERQKEREKRMEQWRKREATKSKAQRKQESESRNPNQMAQRFAYWGAMNKRMQARGIEPPRFGPGGGGPGGPGGGGRRGGG